MFENTSYMILLITIVIAGCVNVSTQTFINSELQIDEPSNIMISDEELPNKHESLKSCSTFILDPDEYVMFPNKTAHVPVYNKTYEEEHYILIGDMIRICAPPQVFNEPPSQLATVTLNYVTITGLAISMLFLLIHLVVFAVVPDLRNLPGCNLASMCLSLFLTYLLMLFVAIDSVVRKSLACTVVAVLIQFFFLGSFLWMLVMAFDVFRSIIKATENLRLSVKGFKLKKYIYNSLICWGIASVFAAAALIADNIEGIDESYRPKFGEFCWFRSKTSLLSFFGGPVLTIICLNFILFAVTAYILFANRMKTGDSSKRAYIKKNYLTYLRLAVIMGVTWITGLLAPLVNLLWLWYLFAILNSLQGLFIFIAFTCTNKVKKYFKSKLLNIRRSSEHILTKPTFQSYCFQGNSIEKYESVGNKENVNRIDTRVIDM
ncbi:G-protein coupled receptor Mth2-like [Argiope bruennichi]|uniref:G-protein coupled receptor Mth2-like n=1 Tax=Argiope bruennichi TaxID=94029 RepID=UPI0024953DF7|nr:G-protein coupled receptor Mth2-like [Argiope bruennichi]XP_055946328.1 G-protein coupled receptor Mth2-like [Argiope bruennichi]